MIKTLKLDEGVFPLHNTDSGDRVLRGLSQINFFVGANNCGKSRFLRSFFAHREREFELLGVDGDAIRDTLSHFSSDIALQFRKVYSATFGSVNRNETDQLKFPTFINKAYDFEKQLIAPIRKVAQLPADTRGINNRLTGQFIAANLIQIGEKALQEITSFLPQELAVTSKDIYIPVLRGLRPFDDSLQPKDFYLDRTIKDYFRGAKKNIREEMYTGNGLFYDCRRLLLGKKSDRDKIKDFEIFLSKTFFSDAEVSIIPRENDHVVHIRIGDDEFPIYELGDGIQAVIILMYPMFFSAGERVNFFIEEPEQFMHPGFQRVFLEALGRKEFAKFQYFITTHSNHLLDLSMENTLVSVFTFRKNAVEGKANFVIRNVKGDDVEILDLLGVRKSSVFLSNCTIWVEGITDRIYLRKYIDLYQAANGERQFTEDIHYSFVEYGGNNITHWSFLDSEDPEHGNIQVERICNRLFLLADSDGEKRGIEEEKSENGTKKAVRHLKLKERLGENYYRLSCREIENLLVPSVIEEVVSQWEGKELDFSAFSEKKYAAEQLGAYIDTVVPGLARVYGDKSGTLKNKVEFAKRAVREIADLNGMSKEANLLAKKLYDFIASHNV